jgi:hypothetical protein
MGYKPKVQEAVKAGEAPRLTLRRGYAVWAGALLGLPTEMCRNP